MENKVPGYVQSETIQKAAKPEKTYLVEYYEPKEGADNVYHVERLLGLRAAFLREMELTQKGMLEVSTYQRVEFKLQTL